jgi:hypothetical protein
MEFLYRFAKGKAASLITSQHEPTPIDRIMDIIAGCAKVEMVGIHAVPHITMMQDH